jgi:hypothetical protein
MRTSARISGRLGAYAASVALVLAGTGLAAAPADADQTQASAAGSWLAGQLRPDGLLPGQFGGGDVGLSIDAGFTLSAVGGQAADVQKIADAVRSSPQGKDYVQFEGTFDYDGDGTPDTYVSQAANATAKALAFLQSLPTPSQVASGIDLVSRLEALTTDTGATAGRIADHTTVNGATVADDFANTLGPSFAARGLTAVGSSEAPAALQFLLLQQCPGGGFRLDFAAKNAASQRCASAGEASFDVTAIVVAQVAALPASEATTRALYDARTWLAGQQASDGSFGGGAGTSSANSNSTGLAAIALGTGPGAERAATWVADRQRPSTASDAGAIAYDVAAFGKAESAGIDPADRDQWQRATAQSAGSLLVTSGAARTVRLSAPGGYLRQGAVVTLTGSGLAADRTDHLSGPGTSAYRTGVTSWQSQVRLPSGTATRAYTLGDDTGRRATAAVKVLGARTLPVGRSRYRVHRGRFVTATVTGLAPGERASVFYKGALVRSGTATSTGVFRAAFRVGRATGVKRIVGVGQFADIRRGSTTIRVVR